METLLNWLASYWIIFSIIIMFVISPWILWSKAKTATFNAGDQKTLQLDGHKAIITLLRAGSYTELQIKIHLEGGTVWEQNVALLHKYGRTLVFPQASHGRTWRYCIMCQNAGEKKLRFSIERTPNSRH